MNGWLLYLVAFYVLAGMSTVCSIGRPRTPMTHREAAITLVLIAFNLYAIFQV